MAGPRFRILPPIAFGLPFTAGLLATWAFGDPVTFPTFAAPIGWALVAAFAVWNGWGLMLMFAQRTAVLPGGDARLLLDRGPFRVSRNPLYLGLAVGYTGGALAIPSFWALVLLPLAVAAVTWGSILPEEAYLGERFGASYEDYRRRVRRWL